MTWIKLCAMTNVEDALAAVDAGADAIGLIFAPSQRRIEPAKAAEIVDALPSTIEKIGVFRNETPANIAKVINQVKLTGVQLHGGEPFETAISVFEALGAQRGVLRRVIKTVHVGPGIEISLRNLPDRGVDAILLESANLNEGGGTGKTFAWGRVAALLPEGPRFIVAGGLSPENVAEAIGVFHPWGVDVCSGVEAEKGKKDHSKMKAFVNAVRQAEKRS